MTSRLSRWGRLLLSGVLLGLGWQQAAFMAHDALQWRGASEAWRRYQRAWVGLGSHFRYQLRDVAEGTTCTRHHPASREDPQVRTTISGVVCVIRILVFLSRCISCHGLMMFPDLLRPFFSSTTCRSFLLEKNWTPCAAGHVGSSTNWVNGTACRPHPHPAFHLPSTLHAREALRLYIISVAFALRCLAPSTEKTARRRAAADLAGMALFWTCTCSWYA